MPTFLINIFNLIDAVSKLSIFYNQIQSNKNIFSLNVREYFLF